MSLSAFVGISHIKEMQRSPLVPRTVSDPTLCGMCCLISGPKEGYMYDVFSSCKLMSYYKYTCDTISVSACNGLLHAITRQGIETYTVRMYAAASDWIRENAAVDIQLDQHLVEQQSLTDDMCEQEHEDDLVKVMNEKETSDKDLESKNADGISAGCHGTETESSPNSASASAQSEASALLTDAVNQEGNENINQDPQIGTKTSVTENVPSSVTCATGLSNTEGLDSTAVVDSSEENTRPSGTEFPQESSSGNKEADSSPTDVKLTVDKSGRTLTCLARFTTGNKSSSPGMSRKGVQFGEIEQSYDSESNAELTASHRTRAFAVSNPLSRNNTTGAKVSDAVYQAAVSKLSSGCGWTLPVFDLEGLRQVGDLRFCIILSLERMF